LHGKHRKEHEWQSVRDTSIPASKFYHILIHLSRFFITLAPCPHLTGKHTVFGHLISGQNVLDRILKVPVDKNDRPKTDVLIARCGELSRRSRATRTHGIMSSSSKQNSEDRGRRKGRRSPSHSPARSESPSRGHDRTSGSRHRHHHRNHHHLSSSPSPSPPDRRNRRRSDASLDHNLRGRPRQRSRHRTRSPILESVSPSRDHRKRSQPPSRRRDSKECNRSSHRRRQRSLPNLYNDENGGSPRKSSSSVFRNLSTEKWLRHLKDESLNRVSDESMGGTPWAGDGFAPLP
jgi:peptidyl-prolyl isomerase G (cyclophilin G)